MSATAALALFRISSPRSAHRPEWSLPAAWGGTNSFLAAPCCVATATSSSPGSGGLPSTTSNRVENCSRSGRRSRLRMYCCSPKERELRADSQRSPQSSLRTLAARKAWRWSADSWQSVHNAFCPSLSSTAIICRGLRFERLKYSAPSYTCVRRTERGLLQSSRSCDCLTFHS